MLRSTESAASLDALLNAVVKRIAVAVVDELRSGELADYIDQIQSPLGSRKHCSAVRRRVAAGDRGDRRAPAPVER
jgi:hypothetical protein